MTWNFNPDTESITMSPLPNKLFPFIVFILVPLTSVSCFHDTALPISLTCPSSVVTLSFTLVKAFVWSIARSYTAFLLGACVVSPSHDAPKAASDIHPATDVCSVVISHCMSEMSHCIVVMFLCSADMLLFIVFTDVAIAWFCTAFVLLLFSSASIVGLSSRSL